MATHSGDPFFILKGNYINLTRVKELRTACDVTSTVKDFAFTPHSLSKFRVKGKEFRNVSFSKKTIRNSEFTECRFYDCRFIGTKFEHVRFSGCYFQRCNFWKAEFTETRINPASLEKAIPSKDSKGKKWGYANIALELFQVLQKNSETQSNDLYFRAAGYQLEKWRTRGIFSQWRRRKGKWWWPAKFALRGLYGLSLGYGYRMRNYIGSICIVVVISSLIATVWWKELGFTEHNEGPLSHFGRSVYFTISVITTLGYGEMAQSGSGKWLTGALAIIGVCSIGVLVNMLHKKVAR